MSVSGRKGRPPCCPKEIIIRILVLTAQDYSLSQIADLFNSENVPTPTGRSRWYKSMVERTTKTLYARSIEMEAGWCEAFR